MKESNYPEFVLLLGEKSEDIFDFFAVDELHGLSREACQQKQDTDNDAYIRGFTNYFPDGSGKKFMFVNMRRYRAGEYSSHTFIAHEAMHLVRMLKSEGDKLSEENEAGRMEAFANLVIPVCEASALQQTMDFDAVIRSKY